MTRSFFAIAVLAAMIALPAAAEQRAYDQGVAGDGDFDQRAPTITPSIQSSPGLLGGGNYLLEDDNAGTVTATLFEIYPQGDSTTNITGFMMAAPGGYIYTRSRGTFSFPPGQSGSGGTDPTESVDWGVLTGFGSTGESFCRSTPPFVCTFAARIEDGSLPQPVSSTTYDIGTWVFDASGDFEGTPYFNSTTTGGVGNSSYTLRGTFFGASLPALPLVGFGALGLGLAVAGARALSKRR